MKIFRAMLKPFWSLSKEEKWPQEYCSGNNGANNKGKKISLNNERDCRKCSISELRSAGAVAPLFVTDDISKLSLQGYAEVKDPPPTIVVGHCYQRNARLMFGGK